MNSPPADLILTFFKAVDRLDVVASTNDYLKDFISAGEPRLVVARAQTSGRGRYGRSWHSPSGEGLYVSCLLFPEWDTSRARYMTQAAGLAVINAIHLAANGKRLQVRLKEPNDILIGTRKVCGILTELGSTGSSLNWLIIGIGVNLYQEKFPPELSAKATSLRLEGIDVANPMNFCHQIIIELLKFYRHVDAGELGDLDQRYEGFLDKAQ